MLQMKEQDKTPDLSKVEIGSLLHSSWGSHKGWFAIPSSSGLCFVRTFHYNQSVLGGPT